jgi:hypothetical protein
MASEQLKPVLSARDRLREAFADKMYQAGSPKMEAFVDAQALAQANDDTERLEGQLHTGFESMSGLITASTTRALVQDRMTQRFFKSSAYAAALEQAQEIADQYLHEGKISAMKKDLIEVGYGSVVARELPKLQ